MDVIFRLASPQNGLYAIRNSSIGSLPGPLYDFSLTQLTEIICKLLQI
jgi:hypothetical protein